MTKLIRHTESRSDIHPLGLREENLKISEQAVCGVSQYLLASRND